MLLWPAIIQYAGQAELVYINDQLQWDTDKHLHTFEYHPADRLIDSNGKVWSICNSANHAVLPELNGESVSLDKLIDLIRKHAAQIGECCIAKISAGSIQEAIKLVETLAED